MGLVIVVALSAAMALTMMAAAKRLTLGKSTVQFNLQRKKI